MSVTPRALIADALYELNVYATGESVSPADEQLAFRHANRMIDGWGVQKLTMYQELRTTKVLASGTASYTIGTGGSISMVRPVWIDLAGIIIDSSAAKPVEVPVHVLTDQEYANWPIKTLGVSPSWAIWYDRAWVAGLGTVYILPIPTVDTTTLVLYTSAGVVPFADLTTALTFSPGYEDALFYQLVMRLQTPFARQASDETRAQAVSTLTRIKTANIKTRSLSCDPALRPSRRGSLSASQFASGNF